MSFKSNTHAFSGISLIIIAVTLLLGSWLFTYYMGDDYPSQIDDIINKPIIEVVQEEDPDVEITWNPWSWVEWIGQEARRGANAVADFLGNAFLIIWDLFQVLGVFMAVEVDFIMSLGIFGVFIRGGIYLLLIVGFIALIRGGS